MLNTPLTKLRKEAPGSITAAKVAAYFKRKRFPRARCTISVFEAGAFRNPTDRFVTLYAEAIGQTLAQVSHALMRTQRMRERREGPFAGSSLP